MIMIKRIVSLMLLLTAVALPAAAQAGLQISKALDGRFRKARNATEIVVTGEKAREIGLKAYHSLTVNGDQKAGRQIESLVSSDGKKAIDKEVEYRDGRIFYGFYTLKPLTKKRPNPLVNRFILYMNQNLQRPKPKDAVILIYMESEQNGSYVKSLIGK